MSAQGTIGSLLLVHKPKMVEIRQIKRDKFLPAEADIAGHSQGRAETRVALDFCDWNIWAIAD